jgi:hypothetical protein
VVQTNVALSRRQRSRLFLLPVTHALNKVCRPFEQQYSYLTYYRIVDAADQMINLGKNLQNNADLITLAQIFAQQPRNSADSLAVPYCQKAPQNTELRGLYPCQFEGTTQNTFTGNLAVGATGTIPFGLSAAVKPAGSWYVICISSLKSLRMLMTDMWHSPAHAAGPIPDGTQLTDITTSPDNVAGRSVNTMPNRGTPAASSNFEKRE